MEQAARSNNPNGPIVAKQQCEAVNHFVAVEAFKFTLRGVTVCVHLACVANRVSLCRKGPFLDLREPMRR